MAGLEKSLGPGEGTFRAIAKRVAQRQDFGAGPARLPGILSLRGPWLLLPENSMLRTSSLALTVGLLVAIAAAKPPAPNRDYRAAMRQFVRKISLRAKKANPAFLVVPQGGVSLLTDKGKPAAEYLEAIDGIGQEEIFYGFDNRDDRKTPKQETTASSSSLRWRETPASRFCPLTTPVRRQRWTTPTSRKNFGRSANFTKILPRSRTRKWFGCYGSLHQWRCSTVRFVKLPGR
jgi:hypothetical protein